MKSNDNISEGFKELLGDIKQELDSLPDEKEEGTPSEDNNPTSGGTRVFDTVKPEITQNQPTQEQKNDTIIVSNANSTQISSETENSLDDFTVESDDTELKNPIVSNKNEAYADEKISIYQPNVRKEAQFNGYAPQNAQTNIHPKVQSFNANDKVSIKTPVENEKTKAPASKTKKKKKKKVKKYGIFGSLVKFILYIVFITVVSVFLAKYIISVGNDLFAFVKDTYEFSDITYQIKGETDNTFKITNKELSGNKFTFEYEFKNKLTDRELNSLEANISMINTTDNSVVYNYGKYHENIAAGKEISIDLSDASMKAGDYLLNLTINVENNVSFITEFSVSKMVVDIDITAETSTDDLAKVLEAEGIIDHPFAFKLYTQFKKGRSGSSLGKGYVEGTHQLYSGMAYDDIIAALSPRVSARSIVKLTFPEGSTVDEIIDILIKGGIKNSKQDYIDVINNYDFDYKFVELLDNMEMPEGRVYRLEGYLFPDTYEFYSDAKPETVINKFLSNFDAKFDDSFYDEAEKAGYTVDEIITIASLIEMEAGNEEDKWDISSVFHNRIKSVNSNSALKFNLLQSDATTNYNSINFDSKFSLSKDCKSGSFSIDLSKYDLIDGNYYFNFNINTGKTRSVALIHLRKSTNGSGNTVYNITSYTVDDSPVAGSSGNNLQVSLKKAEFDGSVIKCELGFNHAIDEKTFKSYSRKLNLFRFEYNTYLSEGIIPSAISNPGYDSITAALYPNDTNYYYFVADSSGKSHFTRNNSEHNAKVQELQDKGMKVTIN